MKELTREELIQLIANRLLLKIQEEENISSEDAKASLYATKLYPMLMDEETKVWHFSVPQLYEVYRDEVETGILDFDNEVERPSADEEVRDIGKRLIEKHIEALKKLAE